MKELTIGRVTFGPGGICLATRAHQPLRVRVVGLKDHGESAISIGDTLTISDAFGPAIRIERKSVSDVVLTLLRNDAVKTIEGTNS